MGHRRLHADPEELGDLLFAVCNVARKLDVDAEGALRQANYGGFVAVMGRPRFTSTGAGAAFRFRAANWHPLTWLSHLIDVSLFGLRPGPHHVVSVLTPLLDSLLIFALLPFFTLGEDTVMYKSVSLDVILLLVLSGVIISICMGLRQSLGVFMPALKDAGLARSRRRDCPRRDP